MIKSRTTEAAGQSSALDAESFLKLGGKLFHGVTDLGGLFGERGCHALCGFGFAADEFHGGHHQREMVVDVVAHGGEMLVQLFSLLGS